MANDPTPTETANAPESAANDTIASMIPSGPPAPAGAAPPIDPAAPVEPFADDPNAELTHEDVVGAVAAPIALPEFRGGSSASASQQFGLLLDVGVEVAAVVGTRELKLEQVLAIQPGTIIDIDRNAGEPIELYVNGKPIARAEIVVVDGRLGARVVETLASPMASAS